MPKPGSVSSRLLMTCLACALLLCGCANSSTPSGTPSGTPSSASSGGPSRSPTNQTEGESSGPTLKWTANRGGGIYSSLVTAGGVVYVTTNRTLYALDAATGTVKWKWSAPSYPMSSVAVENNTVYVGAMSASAYAFDTETGDMKWQQLISNDPSEGVSNPIAIDGLVYFGTGWSNWSCCEGRGSGGGITALDGETGQIVWHVKTVGSYGSGGLPTSTFSVGDDMLYFTDKDVPDVDIAQKQLHALDRKTGKEVWKIASEHTVPFIAPDDTLYVAYERTLLSLDGKTGQKKWRWELDPTKASLSEPTVVEDTLYVVGNEERDVCFEGPCPPRENHTDTLYALDSVTGKERWQQDIDGGYYSTWDITHIQQYLCYHIADHAGDPDLEYLRAVGLHDGKFRWQYEIDDSLLGLPLTEGDTMYFLTDKGTVYALQLP
jgi:outer membrane protein assembly factor BamB